MRNAELKQLVEMNAEHDFNKLILNAACVIYVLYYFFVFMQ